MHVSRYTSTLCCQLNSLHVKYNYLCVYVCMYACMYIKSHIFRLWLGGCDLENFRIFCGTANDSLRKDGPSLASHRGKNEFPVMDEAIISLLQNEP